MKKFSLLITTTLAACSLAIGQTNGTITPEKGQKYFVETKINTTSSSEMMGQTMETKADVTSTYNIEVKDVAGENINFTNTITGLKMNVNMMGQDLSFDSDKKEDMDGDIGKNFQEYINKPKNVMMDKSGNIVMEKKDSAAEKADDKMQNPTSMMMKQMGGDPEELGYGAKMTFHAVPKNLKAGSTWTDSSTDKGITRVTNYKLDEINGSEGKLSLSGTISSEMTTEMQGMEVLTKTTGKFTGEEILDLKTGLVKQNSSTTDASGTFTVMGQEIPTSSKITSITTVKNQ